MVTCPSASSSRAGRTRPLCAYPQVVKYKGNGSIDDAGNFVCSAPEPK
jgi:feruloyl esterase